jgi:predicted nucleotidyltransferase
MNREEIILFLKEFKKTTQNKYHIRRIGLFGSMARNTKDEPGDIDIVVELESPDLFILADIKYDIEKKFKKHVDIVRKRENMNHFLKRRIEREAIFV